jgi:hypothetical protein
MLPAVMLAALLVQDPAPSPPSPPQDPQWFDKLLTREVELPAPVDVVGPDGVFRARVPAKLRAAPEAAGDSHYVVLDMGATGPVECWVYSKEKDAATTLTRLANATLGELAQQQGGSVARKLVQATDAGTFGPDPFLELRWIFRLETPRGAQAGQLKQRIALRGSRSVYCHHAETGYQKSFAAVFEALVRSLEWKTPEPAPYYSEVSTATFGSRTVGYTRLAFFEEEDGDTRIVDQTSMLVPTGAEALNVTDTYRIQFSRPDGTLINEKAVEVEQGELTSNLDLAAGEGGWAVSGTTYGKAFSAKLEAHPLLSDLGQMLEMRRFLARAERGATHRFREWTDEVPDRLVDAEVVVEDVRADEVAGRVSIAGMSLDVVFDKSGSMVSGRLAMGAHALLIRRMHREGSVPRVVRPVSSLYLHEIPLEGSTSPPAEARDVVTVALHMSDPTTFVTRLPTAVTPLAASGHVELRVPDDLTWAGAVQPRHRQASFVIDIDQPPVRELAASLRLQPGSSLDDLVAAADLAITDKGSGAGWHIASQVARRRAGDCTEHAVLLAALARFAGRPARVVIGVVLVWPSGAFPQAFGHAWTEIAEGEVWRRADATPIRRQSAVRYVPLMALDDEGPGFSMELMRLLQSWPSKIEILAGRGDGRRLWPLLRRPRPQGTSSRSTFAACSLCGFSSSALR